MSEQPASAFLRRWRPGPLLPAGDARDGALGFVIAVLCFFACLTALTALAGDRAARGWTAQLQSSATVLVRPSGAESADAAAARAAETLAGVKGVGEVQALSRDKAVALLQPWIGKDALPNDLPIPRLVAVELSKTAPASAQDLDRALKAQGVDATVDDHSVWIADILRAGSWIRLAALGLFALTAAAAGAMIAFAAGAALAARHEIVQVLHIAGAEDRFIAGLVQRRFALLAACAGLFAALAAAMIGAAARVLGGDSGLTPVLPVAWTDLLVLPICPLAAALVAATAARLAALRLLKDLI
ncbi:MAG TPA: ABC transporter permease [Caulobacteraceae bacterium]|nr:ABC transporter permease [Caulobacteraceae bacterium]